MNNTQQFNYKNSILIKLQNTKINQLTHGEKSMMIEK